MSLVDNIIQAIARELFNYVNRANHQDIGYSMLSIVGAKVRLPPKKCGPEMCPASKTLKLNFHSPTISYVPQQGALLVCDLLGGLQLWLAPCDKY